MIDRYPELSEKTRQSPPLLALVLGSGLSDLAHELDLWARIPFLDIPGLTNTSVAGHHGCLLFGAWAGKPVLVFAGRLHFYEGHPWRGVLQPMHIAHALGTRRILLTNAAGGIRDDLAPGSLMALRDHRDWTRPCFWRHEAEPSPYSPRLLQLLQQAARRGGVDLAEGIYAQVTGSSYETPAEVRALRTCGADAVGMSTVREVLMAHELGMECAAISCITNRACGLGDGPLHHDEVLETAARHRQTMGRLLGEFLGIP